MPDNDLGIKRIFANVMAANKGMLHLFEDRGFDIKREEYDTYAVSIDLEQAMPFTTGLAFQGN